MIIMKKIDKYLRVIQEQFNARIALTDINGDFENEWTNCYEVKCYRRFENKYEKNVCKYDCQKTSVMKAIARISSIKSKCNEATEPNRCVNTMENGILRYEKMMNKIKEAQIKVQAKLKAFQVKSGV